MDKSKEAEARGMIQELYAIQDEVPLSEWQQAMLDVLLWLFEDADQPEVE